jgi:hypothetical protein
MSYRFRIPLDPGAGWYVLVVGAVVAAVLVVWSVVTGQSAQVEISFVTPTAVATAAPEATPEAAVPPEAPRVGALVAPVPSETWPPVQSVIGHYFGPLGATVDALEVADCETGGTFDPSLVGPHGEQGVFQLLPGGAGAPFVAAGWTLLDARENVVAAALVVARDGWDAWSACR